MNSHIKKLARFICPLKSLKRRSNKKKTKVVIWGPLVAWAHMPGILCIPPNGAPACGTVDSTRGVHLIKDLHIALANKPLQICFQLTVDPKPRLHRSWCYLSELLQTTLWACAAGNWTNHSNWFANRFTGLPTGLIKPLNRIDSK